MSVAWLFPGQGSHYVGMAEAWREHSAAAAEALEEADSVLGIGLSALMREGPEAELSDTYNQQPALLAASVAVLRACGETLPEPAFVAGHSLGEYSALVAADALDYADALRLVRERGRLMRDAGQSNPGSMAALLGMTDEAAAELCAEIEGVWVANYNAPGQVVISGRQEAVAQAAEAAKTRGAKRAIVLPITIAAHSALMAPAAAEFQAVIDDADLRPAQVPLIANLSAVPIQSAQDIAAELKAQLTGSVRWTEGVRHMIDAGVDHFIEIGSGSVLSGLVKRIGRELGRRDLQIQSMDQPG